MKTMQPKSSPRIHGTRFRRLNFPRKSKPLCGTFSMMPSQLEQSSVKEDYRSQAIILFPMRGRKLYHISFCIATFLYCNFARAVSQAIVLLPYFHIALYLICLV